MDWAARLFGLDDVFTAASEQGGGIIQVRNVSFSPRRLILLFF